MMRQSYRSLAAAFAVVLGVAVAGANPVRAASIDPLIPTDADTVIFFNARQFIDSEIIKKYALEQMKQTLQGDDAQKMLKQLGLDPLKDIDTMIIGGTWTDANNVKGIAIIHGTFDADKLYKAAEAESKKNGDKFSMIKDGDDVYFKIQPDNGSPVYATVVNKATVVVANEKKLLATAVKAAAADKPAALDKDLSARIAKMDSKASMWATLGVKGKLDKLQLPPGAAGPNVDAQLAKMETLSVVLRVSEDVSLELMMGMADDESANGMGETVDDLLKKAQGLIPFLAANDPKLKPLTELGKSLKSGVKGKVVSVSAKLSGDAIGKMLPGGD